MKKQVCKLSKKLATGFAVALVGLCVGTISYAEPLIYTTTERGVDWTSGGISGVGGGSGTIVLSGITGPVDTAYLYWYGIDADSQGAGDGNYDNANVMINGNAVVGAPLGTSGTNCWGNGNSVAYRADVSAYVAADGPYLITDLSDGVGHDANGASIVVTFDDGDDSNDRNLYFLEGNDSNVDFEYPGEDDGWHGILDPVVYSGGDIGIQFHGGDGQSAVDDTLTIWTVNGLVDILDTPALWDGLSLDNAGTSRHQNPINGLYDIHDFDITPVFNGELGPVALNIGGQLLVSDCIGAILAVVDKPTDFDQDGVDDDVDLCPLTTDDEPTRRLGRNRWIWEEGDWITNAKGVEKDFTMEQTQGCSCEQILDVLVDKTDQSFDGHYKFGCSQSVVEDWISGLYFMETVEVPAADTDGVDSDMTLKSTEDYQLMAYGVADALNSPGFHIPFDAKYSVTTQVGEVVTNPADWTDLVTLYEAEGTELLDLHVDAVNVDWGAFNPAHVYWHGMPGTDSPVNLWIYDIFYPNNAGSLFVDIYVELW